MRLLGVIGVYGIHGTVATEVEGTFRVNGSNKRMRELQAIFETPPKVSLQTSVLVSVLSVLYSADCCAVLRTSG